MHFDSDSIRVQVVDIQDFELLHQGPVLVLGGTLHTSLTSFFCSIASDLMYVFRQSAVPHTVILPMRWG